MLIYHRYASGDDNYKVTRTTTSTLATTQATGSLNASSRKKAECMVPLEGGFGSSVTSIDPGNWNDVFDHAHYFIGFDPVVFGYIVVLVFKNVTSGELCTRLVTKYGVTSYNDLMLDSRLRFAVACDNLIPEYRHSKLRKALAITMLKNFLLLANNPGSLSIPLQFDETDAGRIASSMEKLRTGSVTSQQVGESLKSLGCLSPYRINAHVVDTIYLEGSDDLVQSLGDHVDQLFDPLLEYSPQAINVVYTPSSDPPPAHALEALVQILDELLTVQTNYTMNLVNLLQNFIVPLRIFILEHSQDLGISKINKIFAPTVDEITRVNCILHDSLAKAEPHGVVEVLRALLLVIPYFYKAFIRHEANLKHFHSRLDRFYLRYESRIFDNPEVNKGEFSRAEIDLIVLGSLGELPKLKMLLDRLVPLALDLYRHHPKIQREIRGYHTACVDIIKAFGDEGAPNGPGPNHRVFTPTGKMLTEIATNWPLELEQGWLARKVVGIFELRREPDAKIEVLVVFSDLLLFLSVDDKLYATGESPVYVLDTLMHSLVNEKPLPTLGVIPPMLVRYWAKATECIALAYGESHIRFVSTNERGFRVKMGQAPVFGESYLVLPLTGGKRPALPETIIELVAKLSILHKSNPFHLFRSKAQSKATGPHTYFTTTTVDQHQQELCKLPFALYLEVLDESEISDVFDQRSDVRLVMTAHICEDDRDCLVVLARNRLASVKVDLRLIDIQDLPKFVRKMVGDTYRALIHETDGPTRALIAANANGLEQWCAKFRSIASKLFSPPVYPAETFEAIKPEEDDEVAVQRGNTTVKRSPVKVATPPQPRPQSTAGVPNPKRKLFISLIFLSMKRKLAPPGLLPVGHGTVFARLELAKKNIAETFIPRGSRMEYKHLHLAAPDLVQAPSSTFATSTTFATPITNTVPVSKPVVMEMAPLIDTEVSAGKARLEDAEFTDESLGLCLLATPLARRSTAPTLRQSSTRAAAATATAKAAASISAPSPSHRASPTRDFTPGPNFERINSIKPKLDPVSVPIIGTPMGLPRPELDALVEPNLNKKLIFKVDLPWDETLNGGVISEIAGELLIPYSTLFNADLYSDGGSNWILITRDNSSLYIANGGPEPTLPDLQEVAQGEDEIADDATVTEVMDVTLPVQEAKEMSAEMLAVKRAAMVVPDTDYNSTLELLLDLHDALNLVDDFITHFKEENVVLSALEIQAIRKLLLGAKMLQIPRTESVQLVSALMYARDLGAEIDRSFSTRHLLGLTQDEYTSRLKAARAPRPARTRSLGKVLEDDEMPVRFQSSNRFSRHASVRVLSARLEEKRFSNYVINRQEARYSKYSIGSYDPEKNYEVADRLAGLSDATIYDETEEDKEGEWQWLERILETRTRIASR